MTDTTMSLTKTPRVYRDDVARVFDRMHVQHGVSFDFPVGLQHEEGGELAWEWFSHVDYDGMNMVEHVARRHGEQPAIPQLKIRPTQQASLRDHLRPLFRKSYLRKAPASPWDPPKRVRERVVERQLPQHLIMLSDDETRGVAEVARGHGVSVNSLVLWSIAAATRTYATRPDDRQHWTIPVNMRGGLGISPEAANPISFIRVPIWPNDTPAIVHARLYDLLETGMHWVMLRWVRFFANRSRMKFPPVRSTGVFSNIGVFRIPSIHRLVFAPPTGPTEPLAASLITWNGRMSLALAVDPTMNPPPGAVDAVGARWRTAIMTGAL